MKPLKLLWCALAAIAVMCLAHDAFAWQFAGSATFKADGTVKKLAIDGGGIRLSGSATLLEDGKATAELLADLREVVTGLSLRDKHLRETYFEVSKYPTARLSLLPFRASAFPTDFCGSLTLKADTHQVCGVVTVENLADKKKVDATFTLRISDFPSLGTPRYLGVGVKDWVTVRVFGEATPKK